MLWTNYFNNIASRNNDLERLYQRPRKKSACLKLRTLSIIWNIIIQ